MVCIELFGPFRLLVEGRELWVSSKKGQALIALLAMAPNGERTRSWLIDKLWTSRGPRQGQASLRRELSTLRALDPALAGALGKRGDRLSLDLRQCVVDAHAPPAAGLAPQQFLEGIDLTDAEGFEDWLTATRQQLAAGQPPRREASPAPPARPAFYPAHRSHFCIGLMTPEILGTASGAAMLAHDLLDAIARELTDRGGSEVFDFRNVTAGLAGSEAGGATLGPDAILLLRLRQDNETGFHVSARLVRAGTRRVMWSRQSIIERSDETIHGLSAAIFINEAAEEIQFALSTEPAADEARHYAACHAIAAIHQAFGLQPGSLMVADTRFSEAYRLSGQPVYLAWRAYLSSFLVDPTLTAEANRQTSREIADIAERVLAEAPYNTQCLALLIHVYGFALRDFRKASALIDRAKALGARNLMFFDSTALFHIYTNRPDQARAPAQAAAEMGRFLPYRYAFETTLMMIDTLEGHFDKAMARGQNVLGMVPGKGAQPFAPALRFLASACDQTGRVDQAASYLETLHAREPDLTQGLVDDRLYPLPSERARSLFKTALSRFAA